MAESRETNSSLENIENENKFGLLGAECFKYIKDYTPFKFNEKFINKRAKKYFAFSICEKPINNINQKNKIDNNNSLIEEYMNKKDLFSKLDEIKEKDESNQKSNELSEQNDRYFGISIDDIKEEDESDFENKDMDEEDFIYFGTELRVNNFSIRPDNCLKNILTKMIETHKTQEKNSFNETKKEEKIILTEPSKPKCNNMADNEYKDLIVCKYDIIKNNNNNYNYIIIDLLGTGISGQTFKVLCQNDNKEYALKIIKNGENYTKAGKYEYLIMNKLNELDKNDEYHIIRSYDCFIYKNHLCIVIELMQRTLLKILEDNAKKGLSLTLIRFITQQILSAIDFIHNNGFVHTDLKPENLLYTDLEKKKVLIKVADFGSASLINQLIIRTRIQSMFYKAPEVIMGLPLNEKVDVWSIGCIIAEFYLNTPLLPGSCNYDQLNKIFTLIGDCPQLLIICCKNRDKYFTLIKEENISYYRIKKPKEYYKEFPEEKPREYNTIPENIHSLDDLIYIKRDLIKGEKSFIKSLNGSNSSLNSFNIKEKLDALIHLLKGMLQIDPNKRLSCAECLKHPFIMNEKLEKKNIFNNNNNKCLQECINLNNKSNIQNDHRNMNNTFNNNINNIENKFNSSFGCVPINNFLKMFPNYQRYSESNNSNDNYNIKENNKNNSHIQNNNNYYNMNNYNNPKINSSFSYNLYQNNFFQNHGVPYYINPPNYFPNNYNNYPNYFYQNNNNPNMKQNKSFFGNPPQNFYSSFTINQNYNFQKKKNFRNKKYDKDK